MLPEDVVEIKMKKNSGAFFTQFDESLYLDIDLIKTNGKVVTHGPFDTYDLLSGFTTKDNNYVLRFTNEGEYLLVLSIILSVKSYPNADDFNNSDLFPFLERNVKGPIANGIQFYYEEKDVKSFVPIYITLSIFGLFFIIIWCFHCHNL
ncbi:hypothetical protein M9Y10_007586 [Tritrichomonas musculus]|uniref:Uncharacterized protein n=1 Tax=Tritrichomonas musculus TaxID=1915356 RepID=A0ABR2J1R6_9EUKA